jgi:hypothetical protein
MVVRDELVNEISGNVWEKGTTRFVALRAPLLDSLNLDNPLD